jgi:large subunit ribosomal protein L23
VVEQGDKVMSKTITLRPRLSEKTYELSEKRVYVVEVPSNVNRHSVARAIEAQFEVKVVKVNILNVLGKPKRIVSITGKRMKNDTGKRSDSKKAYITLAKGQSLPFFAAIEEEEAKEQATQSKVDKAAEKAAKKTETRRGFRRKKTDKGDEA